MFDFNFTPDKLKKLIPSNANADQWHAALTKILPKYNITSARRVAAFLAQTIHESGEFKVLKENLNYKSESLMRVFPKYFPDVATAQKYAHNQQAIANRVYANRMGNGDEASGDGFKFCGRGLIQLTGRNNYKAFAESVKIDLEKVPEFLATVEGAVQSACWFWDTNKLNLIADRGDITTLSKRINGGTIGLEERIKHYNKCLEILGS